MTTAQARYQARRRQANRPVTFFPADRQAMVDAAALANQSQQDWLNDAVAEKIGRAVAQEVHQAIERFGPTCLWNVTLSGDLATDLPIVVDRIRKYGGLAGWRLAARIARLAGRERTSWR